MKKTLPQTNQTAFSFVAALFFIFISVVFCGQASGQDRRLSYTTPGTYTWTPPCGVNNIQIFVWGAGGAGGGARNGNTRGGGGGAGAFVWNYNLPVTFGTTYQIIIGEGGDGDSGDDGNDGENTTFRIQSGTIIMRSEGGKGGDVDGDAGAKGEVLVAAPGSWGIHNWGGGAGAPSSVGYGGGGGASGSPNFNEGVTATGSAGAIAALGAYPQTDGGNGGNGRTNHGNGFSASSPGGGGGGARRTSDENRRGGHGADGKILIVYNGIPDGYCKVEFNNSEPITHVNFAGINHSETNVQDPVTFNNAASYQSFCDIASVSRGGTFPITVNGNTAGNYFNYVSVFIDWDQNGSFNTTNERYKIGYLNNTDGQTPADAIVSSITVPGGAALGYTKMRVYKHYIDGPLNSPTKCPNDACYNNISGNQSGHNSSSGNSFGWGQAEDYIVSVSGACQQPTGATANNTSGNLNICVGQSVTLRQTGGVISPGQSWIWSKACGGTQENTNTNSDAEYTFTPSGPGITTFYVWASGTPCVTPTPGNCVSVTLTVHAVGTISPASGYTTNFSACRNIANANHAVFNVGGGATGATATGLPAGLNGGYNSGSGTFTISGTPTDNVGTYNYTINLTGNSPCVNPTINGTITITDKPSFSYSGGPFTYCLNSVITPNEPIVNTGGLPSTFTDLSGLPAGLTIDGSTGIISGTPTSNSALTTYTIRASNGCGDTDVGIQIQVTAGNVLHNITPNGSQTICSTNSVAIGLDDSETGIDYQLYRDGSPVGAVVNGTGAALAFGNHSTAGTYTVVAVTNCATNMTGSYTLNVTPQPTATFNYASPSFCKTSANPVPTITGIPATNAIFSTSAGLVWANNVTGEINLAVSNPGIYQISYTAPAFGGCPAYSFGPIQVEIITARSIFDVTGGGSFCAGGAGVPVGLSSSQSGIQYQLYIDGVPGVIMNGTGSSISFGNQTVAGDYTITATAGTCTQEMNGEVTIVVNPSPTLIAVSPAVKTICQGSVVPVTAAFNPISETTNTYSVNSGGTNMNIAIPGNSNAGISNTIRVSGVPAGATINWISINMYITHTYVGDLRIHLKGPNGNVLNIVNRRGGKGDNFGTAATQTTVASNGTANIANIVAANAPFNSVTYFPEGIGGLQGATVVSNNISNATGFFQLFDQTSINTNGNWILSVADLASGDNGELEQWGININYTTVSGQADVTWSSALDLFSDPAGTIPYSGAAAKTIFVKPQIAGNNQLVTATLSNNFGCFTTASATLNVDPAPQISITADYCNTGGTPGTVKLTATSNIAIASWVWSSASVNLSGNTATTSFIEVNTAGNYFVSGVASGNTCIGSDVMKISQELIQNGNFELGNTGFTSQYYYQADVAGNMELWDHNANGETNGYGVGTNANNYHPNFWGVDHTTGTGTGNFMIVNGHGTLEIWKQEGIPVIPGTTYYFSGYGMALNNASELAELQFEVNDVPVGNILYVSQGVNNNSNNGWGKFWGSWTAGAGDTEAKVKVINNNPSLGGNDFGLDDLSFGTLSVFFNVSSSSADILANQNGICEGTPIKDIILEYGGNGMPPTLISGSLPPGVTATDHGRIFRISGTPSAGAGGTGEQSYTFTYQLATDCGNRTVTQTIKVIAASKTGVITGTPLIAACYGASGTIALSGTIGSNYTWQTSTDSTTWVAAANGNYGPVSNELFIRVQVQNQTCAVDAFKAVKIGVKNLWTGKSSTAWNNFLNWSDRNIPNQSAVPCPTTIIPVVANSRYPLINVSTAQVYNLQVNPGASVTILNDAKLQIAGSISSNAAINANDGTIEMNGATQTISGSNFVGKNIERLIVSGTQLNVSSTPNDTLNITEKLSFNSTAGLNTGDNITLKSTLNKTASVGMLNTGNSISGRFTVERIIRHFQNWNMITLPVRENISVRDSWQEGGAIFTSNGFGTRITGPASPAPVGLDVPPPTPGYSLKWWDHNLSGGAGNWVGVFNSTTELANRPQGFFIFVRGDRGIAPGPAGSITTLRGKGTIYDAITVPSLSVTAPANTKVTLANPYASAIQINKLVTTHGNSSRLQPHIWVWDPTLWGHYGVGGYQTISAPTGSVVTPGGGAIYNSGNFPNIQSGHAVYVQTTVANPIIAFNEDMKVDSSRQVQRGGSPETINNVDPSQVTMLSTHLYATDGRMYDGNRVVFDDIYNDEVDMNDAEKINNSYINFGLKRFNKSLIVEARSSLKATDTLYYNMSGLPTGNFKLGVSVQNIHAPHLRAELIDNYLHTRTPVSLTDSSFVNFSTTADAGSKAANRFLMVFQPSQVVLPVTFVQVAAQRNADRSIDVQWKVANEVNIVRYEVERSADSRNFSGILTRDAANYDTYRQTDLSPLAEDNFYRIKAIGLAGDITYSNTVKVAPEKSPALIVVSPNPVKGKQMNVRFVKQPAGEYQLVLTNNNGSEIYRGSVTVSSGSLIKTIALHPSTAGGAYRLAVFNKNGDRVAVEQVMVE